jgi:DNA-binding transcriptional MerR regulator
VTAPQRAGHRSTAAAKPAPKSHSKPEAKPEAKPQAKPEAKAAPGPDPVTRRVEKSPSAFRTISEVAEELDVPQHVLRFWESKFPQVRPLKRGGGRRYYRPEDVDLLGRIRQLLYADGYTIKGVQRLMREGALKVKREAHGDAAHGEGPHETDAAAHADAPHAGAARAEAARPGDRADDRHKASPAATPAAGRKPAAGGVLDVAARSELKGLLAELLSLREDLRRLAG